MQNKREILVDSPGLGIAANIFGFWKTLREIAQNTERRNTGQRNTEEQNTEELLFLFIIRNNETVDFLKDWGFFEKICGKPIIKIFGLEEPPAPRFFEAVETKNRCFLFSQISSAKKNVELHLEFVPLFSVFVFDLFEASNKEIFFRTPFLHFPCLA
jgi:hypothetical protein